MKCDEQLPVCQNCINSKRKCYRGIRLNFTQYTIYDPLELSVGDDRPSNAPKFLRLLDQSIAILSQYEDGKDRYRRYIHLHTQQELDEADLKYYQDINSHKIPTVESGGLEERTISDLQPMLYSQNIPYVTYQVPLMASLPDAWQFASAAPDPMVYNFAESIFYENYDIKNLLMNPDTQSSVLVPTSKALVMPLSSPFTQMERFSTEESTPTSTNRPEVSGDVMGELGLICTTFDSKAFIKLIHNQRYYWILDLFNELDVWKSMVPNYCVRIVQASESAHEKSKNKNNSTFLLDCLLDCQEFTSIDRILNNAREQQLLWSEFDVNDVTASSFETFEQILLSIALILLSMLFQATQPSFVITDTFNMVLSNQGKFFRKVIARYQRIPESVLKTLPTSLLTTASFQAIVALRFLLKMQLKKTYPAYLSQMTSLPFVESQVLGMPIVYDLNYKHTVAEFFNLSPFEESCLSAQFQDLDINEIGMGKESDSAKLRKFFWSLVELDYYGDDKIGRTFVGPQRHPERSVEDTKICALRLNDKCIAFNILVAYSQRVKSNDNASAEKNTKLHEIFQMIELSSIGEDLKSKWTTHFLWTFDV